MTNSASAVLDVYQVLGVPVVMEPPGPCSRRGPLVISEIMYHPSTRADMRNLEFIEIFNSGTTPQRLDGFRLSGDVDFTFPPNTTLAAAAYLVVAANLADLQSVYGVGSAVGNFTNNLPNDRGTIRLRNKSDAVLLEVNYGDSFPWPVAADGSGHSLMLARPSFGEGDPLAWSASGTVGGTPGGPETAISDLRTNLFLNEICAHHADPTQNFVELYNHTATNVDVGGWWLTDDPATNKFRIPEGTTLAARGFAAFTQTQLGFPLDPTGGRVFLFNAPRTRVADAVRYGPQALNISWGRSPDGSTLFSELAMRTPAGMNSGAFARPVVFNEIMYHPISGRDDDEFLELFNRSAGAVNIGGWRLSGGVSYNFVPGTMIAGRGHLVVAKNAARLLTNYPGLSASLVVGNFGGSLSGGGERLALSMPQTVFTTNGATVTSNTSYILVNELTYNTGGRWGKWADGGGASLELIDSASDNRLAANWADSAAATNAPWTILSYTGPHEFQDGNSLVTALEISLLGEGECVLDDIDVHATGGANLISNSNFTSTTGWTFEGNHDLSNITNSGGINNSGCLYLRAASRGDYLGSRVATTWASQINTNVNGMINVKARWLRGWPELLCRLRGNSLEATGPLLLPTDLGTPGRANSRAVTNAGPAIFEVAHNPVLPAAGEAIVVTARALDPNGITNISLRYRLDPSTMLTTLGMNDSGTNGDAIAADGIYSATIPGQASGALVAFHIRTVDATGVAATFPADATARECLVRFGEVQPAGSFGTYRLWITAANASSWATRSSTQINNRPLDVTFVYNNVRAIYNAGGAYNGSDNTSELYTSPTGALCGYTLSFPGDDQFLGATEAVLDWPTRDTTAQREQLTYWMANEVGLPFNHRRYVRLHVNGVRESQRTPLFGNDALIYEDLQSPGGDYLKQGYPDHDHGDLFKIHVWRRDYKFPARPSPNQESFHGSLEIQTDQAGQKHLPRYRWTWRKRAVEGSANDYQSLFELIDAANIANARAFVCDLDTVADTEQWMRVLAYERCIGNFDSYGNRNAQNMYAYKPSRGGRWQLHTFDNDLVLDSTSEAIGENLFGVHDGAPVAGLGIPEPVLQRMSATPAYLRAYWRAFRDFVNGPMDSANFLPFANAQFAALQANGVSVSGPGTFSGWISGRRSYIQSQLANVNTSFSINAPTMLVSSNLLTLSGTAPIDVKTILINGEKQAVTWTGVTSWSLTVALAPGTNQLSIVGLDLRGGVFSGASNSVTVKFSGGSDAPEQNLVINEIMHHPAMTNAEFIELFNRSTTTAFDLTDWRLEGLDFKFPDGTVLGPRAFLVVAKDRVAFGRAYGFSIPLVGEFNGNFRFGGETLDLVRPVGTNEVVVNSLTFEDALPWPLAANGSGPSLQLIDAMQDNNRVMNWAAATATPGAANFGTTSLPAFPLLWINEVQPTNSTGLVDNFGERDPWVELFNAGPVAITLTGFYLSDNFTNLTRWAFPAGTTIAPGEFQLTWLDAQAAQTTGTNRHASFRLNATNGSIALVSTLNNRTSVVDYLNYSAAAPDLSFGSFPDGDAHLRQWFAFPTPRRTNDSTPPPAPVRINEWMAGNASALSDPTFGGFPDWFELFNPSSSVVDLAGWGLSDDPGTPAKFLVPPGVSIGGRGFLLVWADNRGVLTNGELHTNFKLRSGGDEIVLSDPRGMLVDSIAFGAQTNDVSQGRWQNGMDAPYYYMSAPTPRASNTIPNTPAIQILAISRAPSGLVTLLWSATPGVVYRVQFKEYLDDLNWTNLPGDVIATTATAGAFDALPPAHPQRFYRVAALP